MKHTDCPNCAGSGVAFGKRCSCAAAESLPVLGNIEFLNGHANPLPQTDATDRHYVAASLPLQKSDAARLAWALPILVGSTDDTSDARTLALASALLGGFAGRDAIDHAMKITRSKATT